jgi:hypothetical protein
MKWSLFILSLLLILLTYDAKCQLINYSETDNDDVRDLTYEIIGKLKGNIHIYKNNRDIRSITLYDAQMKQVTKEKLDFLPEKIINENFLLFPDSYFMFYEYKKKGIVYCMSVKFDDMGKKIGEPVQLDTTKVSFNSSDKIYTIINSEDKQKIMVVKISKPDEEKEDHVITTLYDKELQLIKRSMMILPMKERNAALSEFQVDNDGDLAFIKSNGSGQSEIINSVKLITKPALDDTININEVNLNGIYLDDVRLKVDNYNKHYLITTLFAKQRGGNVDGFFCYLWDKTKRKQILNTTITFDDDFRNEAKSSGSSKTALDDYYLRNIVAKRDGGFVLAAESYYTTTSNNDPFNRWNSFGSPYYNSYSPYGGSGMFYNPYARNYNNITRYFADNIIMLSVDVDGKLGWSNVIHKAQQDDNTENYISYGTYNSGDKVHFLFNVETKRQNLLTEQSITTDGQLMRSPTLTGLDKGYQFMPRHCKQTGLRQIVVPCQYRNYIYFAKIDF